MLKIRPLSEVYFSCGRWFVNASHIGTHIQSGQNTRTQYILRQNTYILREIVLVF